jgi:hypothetical protein
MSLMDSVLDSLVQLSPVKPLLQGLMCAANTSQCVQPASRYNAVCQLFVYDKCAAYYVILYYMVHAQQQHVDSYCALLL